MIAIVGAGGGLGHAVADHVLSIAEPGTPLLLVTRDPDSLERYAQRGATIRHGDTDKPETLPAALAGARTMLLISTPGHVNETRLRRHQAAIAAAQQADVEHIVYTSAVCATEADSSMLFPSHRQTEGAIKASGRAWTMLRNSLYSDFIRDRCVGAAGTGRYITNAGTGRVACVTRDDCAAVAAAVLTSSGHEGRVYDVTGPTLVDDLDIVREAADILGVTLELAAVDDAGAAADYEAAGLPPDAAEVYASVLTGVRIGAFDVCTTTVSDLTGRQPTSFGDFLRETVSEAVR